MTLTRVQEILDANVLACSELLDSEVFTACGSDLMSDVLAFVKDRGILLTGLVNPQVIRTAEMMDIKAIVFVRGKVPSEDMLNLAKMRDIAIMNTDHTLYTASGLLYTNGLRGSVMENEAAL